MQEKHVSDIYMLVGSSIYTFKSEITKMTTVQPTSTPPTSTDEMETTHSHKEVIENAQPESQAENEQRSEEPAVNNSSEREAVPDENKTETENNVNNSAVEQEVMEVVNEEPTEPKLDSSEDTNTPSSKDIPLNGTEASEEQMKVDQPEQDKTEEKPEQDKTEEKPEQDKTKEIPDQDKTKEIPEQDKTKEIPDQEKVKDDDLKTEVKGEDDVDSAPGACCKLDSSDKSLGPSESIYHVKWVYFKKKQVPIITQNENGPCPLLAIMNVLLLQNRVKLTPSTEIISATQLMVYLGDCVLENVPGDDGVSTPARLNFEQNMSDAMAVMPKLQTGLDVNVRFTGVSHFEYTSESIIFDLLQIALYHGWLVDPQNRAEVTAVGKCSYNQLVEKIITDKTSDQPESVNQALIGEQFLAMSASQLTYHGLCELSNQLKEDELAVLFRNNHFTTLYRHKNELFQLVTDQGFLNEANVVWETLSNVEGDCHFVDSEFRTYTKPEVSLQPVQPPNVALNSDEQIDQDYLVALSLQQEQQQEPMAWGQSTAPMTDLELAQTLQEEERRAAEEAQRQQAMHQQQMAGRNGNQPPAQAAGAQRRQNRAGPAEPRDREEKKSDCAIL